MWLQQMVTRDLTGMMVKYYEPRYNDIWVGLKMGYIAT